MAGEDGEWAVAYHGTAMKTVPLIIDNGFRAGGSADVVAESGRLRPGAAACANFGRRGIGRLPRKCKPRGPVG